MKTKVVSKDVTGGGALDVIFTIETQEAHNWGWTMETDVPGFLQCIGLLIMADGSQLSYDITASFIGDPSNTLGMSAATPGGAVVAGTAVSRTFAGKVAASKLIYRFAGATAGKITFAYSAKST